MSKEEALEQRGRLVASDLIKVFNSNHFQDGTENRLKDLLLKKSKDITFHILKDLQVKERNQVLLAIKNKGEQDKNSFFSKNGAAQKKFNTKDNENLARLHNFLMYFPEVARERSLPENIVNKADIFCTQLQDSLVGTVRAELADAVSAAVKNSIDDQEGAIQENLAGVSSRIEEGSHSDVYMTIDTSSGETLSRGPERLECETLSPAFDQADYNKTLSSAQESEPGETLSSQFNPDEQSATNAALSAPPENAEEPKPHHSAKRQKADAIHDKMSEVNGLLNAIEQSGNIAAMQEANERLAAAGNALLATGNPTIRDTFSENRETKDGTQQTSESEATNANTGGATETQAAASSTNTDKQTQAVEQDLKKNKEFLNKVSNQASNNGLSGNVIDTILEILNELLIMLKNLLRKIHTLATGKAHAAEVGQDILTRPAGAMEAQAAQQTAQQMAQEAAAQQAAQEAAEQAAAAQGQEATQSQATQNEVGQAATQAPTQETQTSSQASSNESAGQETQQAASSIEGAGRQQEAETAKQDTQGGSETKAAQTGAQAAKNKGDTNRQEQKGEAGVQQEKSKKGGQKKAGDKQESGTAQDAENKKSLFASDVNNGTESPRNTEASGQTIQDGQSIFYRNNSQPPEDYLNDQAFINSYDDPRNQCQNSDDEYQFQGPSM